jgi:hypothetical protein
MRDVPPGRVASLKMVKLFSAVVTFEYALSTVEGRRQIVVANPHPSTKGRPWPKSISDNPKGRPKQPEMPDCSKSTL